MRIRALPVVFGATLRLVAVSAAFAAASSLLSPPTASATLAREITLRQLVVRADLVVEGVPEESKAVWEDLEGVGRRIVTYTRVHVSDTAYGEAGGKDVWVRTLGGIVGDLGQTVEGEAELRLGEHAVLFLHGRGDGTHLVVDMAQGHFPMVIPNGASAQVATSASKKAVLRPSPRLGGLVKQATTEPLARVVLRDKSVADAFALIRSERKAAGL
jgi:hypothetical protein